MRQCLHGGGVDLGLGGGRSAGRRGPSIARRAGRNAYGSRGGSSDVWTSAAGPPRAAGLGRSGHSSDITASGSAGGARLVTGDRGSATVLGAVMVLVLVAVATLVVHLGSAVVARHRAAAAADLAALAGARSAVDGAATPCVDAAVIADAGSARLDSCEVSGWEVRVVVSAAAGILGQRATARARAGPDLVTG